MRLFIVTSVYQFLNAVTLQLNDPKEPTDILCALKLLNDTFDWEKLRAEGVFQNVYSWTGEIDRIRMVSKNKKEEFTNNIKKVFLVLGKRKLQREMMRDMPKPRKHYDEICFSYPDYPSRLAFETLRDKDTKCSHLEDGTYTYEAFAEGRSLLKKIAFRILVGVDLWSCVSRVYVYRPDMLRLPGGVKAEAIRIRSELPRIGLIIKNIYKQELPDREIIDKSIIMFDQTLEDSVTAEQQSKVANLIANCYGKGNFVVKMHPRSLLDPYSEDIARYRARCPFEILMSTLCVENKILVSMFSTACMNPKMMLDAEPLVIFTVLLSGLDPASDYVKKMLSLICRFRNTYRDPSRVCVPKTMEELYEIIEKWKSESVHK